MWEHSEIKLHHFVKRATFDGWKISPRSLSDHELVLVLHGNGFVKIGKREHPIESGDLVYFPPQIENSLWVTNKPYMEFYGIHFSIPMGTDDMQFPEIFHLNAPKKLQALFDELHAIYPQVGTLYRWKQNLLLQQILYEALAEVQAKNEPISIMRIRKVLDYIHKDPCRDISMSELLKHAGIRKTLFMETFRRVTDTTPMQYIMGARLSIARELLLETDLPITQIAEHCGFSDPFYFSRCFKKHYHLSPKIYREENLPLYLKE